MLDQHLSRTLMTTPLGDMLVVCSEKGLRGCWFLGQSHFPKEALDFKDPESKESTQIHHEVGQQIELYFNNKIDKFNICIDFGPRGTPFQREVWGALLSIPFGQTSSYANIAQAINRPKAVRAVGGAIGKNPISLIVPCHRVVGSTGALTGYAGGIDRKKALLDLEKLTPSLSAQ